MKKDNKIKTKRNCKLFIVVGIIAIILALSIIALPTGSSGIFKSYGGDAYTGIQNAAAKTATNVYHVAEILKAGFSGILAVAGLACIAYGLSAKESVDYTPVLNEINRNLVALQNTNNVNGVQASPVINTAPLHNVNVPNIPDIPNE